MTISLLLKQIRSKLSAANIKASQSEAELILSSYLKINKSAVHLEPDRHISETLQDQILSLVEKRCHRYPLQYLLEEVHFHFITLKVTPDVLIPRPETEQLVELVLNENQQPQLSVLELCTGSGAIAIALKAERPCWQITASDISQPALELALQNALNNNCRISFIYSNLFKSIKGKFDLIVANPPYLSESEYRHLEPELYYEPALALVAPQNGLFFYNQILSQAARFLRQQGKLYLEIGAGHSQILLSKAKSLNYKNINCYPDFNDFPRFFTCQANIPKNYHL